MAITSPLQSLQLQKELLRPTLIQPFENIALAFSGGGFRAASYTLGVLSFLNEVTFEEKDSKKSLLQKVTYLSSASGGTISTSVYSLFQAEGKSFDSFYSFLYSQLKGDALLKTALGILNDSKEWSTGREEKRRNIINAFARAYDRCLFKGAILSNIVHEREGFSALEEVCFNTTDFIHGLLFHQQVKLKKDTQADPYFFYGNYLANLGTDTFYLIKLGDILAASSCFPAGFEPIIFPDDFTHSHLTVNQLRAGLHICKQKDDIAERQFILNPTFGLMDGGITDNQGLEGMMQADRRRQERKKALDEAGVSVEQQNYYRPFDLMLVNDVTSHFMEPYVVPEEKHTILGALTIKGWTIFLIVLLIAGGIGAFYPFGWVWWVKMISGFFCFSSLLFLVLLVTIFQMIKGSAKNTTGFNLCRTFGKQVVNTLFHFLKSTPLGFLSQMIRARGNSVLTLNNDVFLKRIRQLLYTSFYGSPQWEDRGKGNHIYDLSFSNDAQRSDDDQRFPQIKPSSALQIVAENAYAMGTTLWFDEEDATSKHKEACIIACGQFTTCYNLLLYIYKLKAKDTLSRIDPEYIRRVDQLGVILKRDYDAFNEDPFYLFNLLGVRSNIHSFKKVTMEEIKFPSNFEGIR